MTTPPQTVTKNNAKNQENYDIITKKTIGVWDFHQIFLTSQSVSAISLSIWNDFLRQKHYVQKEK